MTLLLEKPLKLDIVARDYQIADHDESFRLWDSGIVGTLTRIFTGGGKTIASAIKARTWIDRDENNRVMVISYEKELVWQFAQEIEETLGIEPGIEMDSERISAGDIPKIVVASRQSLLCAPSPTPDQLAELARLGINDVGCAPKRTVERYLEALKKNPDTISIMEDIERINEIGRAHV